MYMYMHTVSTATSHPGKEAFFSSGGYQPMQAQRGAAPIIVARGCQGMICDGGVAGGAESRRGSDARRPAVYACFGV